MPKTLSANFRDSGRPEINDVTMCNNPTLLSVQPICIRCLYYARKGRRGDGGENTDNREAEADVCSTNLYGHLEAY